MFNNTRECFSSFARGLGALPESQQYKVIDAIAKFTDTDARSVQIWLDDENALRGVKLIKVRHMLVVSGRKISTFEAMPAGLKTLCGLIAHDAINPDEVFTEVGYPSRDEFFRPITEGATSRTVSPERIDLIERFLTNQKATVRAVQELDLNPTFVSDFPQVTSTVPAEHAENQASFPEIFNLLIAARSIVSVTLPRITELVGTCSAEDRLKFREYLGTKALFDLSNQQHEFSQVLNALCSEKTREIVLREKNRN